MNHKAPCQRLSIMPTEWSLVRRANHGAAESANAARRQLIERYGDAARRYLGKLLPNRDAVEEVFQQFALEVVHGNLRGADPQRGRFRNYVKGTLFHLVADYRQQQRHWPGPLPYDGAGLVAGAEERELGDEFAESWSDELLARAWTALAEFEAKTGQQFYTVLRFRADHPEMRSPQMAEQLSERLGRSITAAAVRQFVHRAREKFADLLLNEVAHSLANPTADEIVEELAEVNLLNYCRPALERRGFLVVSG